MPSGIAPDAIHGEFTSSDASALDATNSKITLYGPGSTSAITLNANDYVIVTDVTISTITALVVDVYDGADATVDAGERITKHLLAANSGNVHIPLNTPHVCAKGTWPKVKTNAAGVIHVTIKGTTYRAGL